MPGKYIMRMGSHSQDSDTTFKEKDQQLIRTGYGSQLLDAMKKNNAQYGSIKTDGKNTTILTITDNRKKSDSKKPAAPKPYVKKGGKATGKMKDYAIGSEARRKEYDARGWTYDDTIKGYNKDGSKKQQRTQLKSPPSTIKPITSADIKPQISASPISIPTIKPSTPAGTTQRKSSKIRAKGQAALDQGNVKKAQRLRRRYDRIQGREIKKAQRQQKRKDRKTSMQIDSSKIYDSMTGFGYDPSKFRVYSAVSDNPRAAKRHAEAKAYGNLETSAFDTKTFIINPGAKKQTYKSYKIYKIK